MRQRTAMPRSTRRSSRTSWRFALWGCCCGLLLALLWCAPATWLAGAVRYASQGRVQLLQPQGTLWNGSAALVLAASSGGTSAMTWPSRWQWSVRTHGMSLGVSLQSACCTSEPLQLRLRVDGVTVQPAAVRIPISLLQGLGAPWNTLQLQGDLLWQSDAMQMYREAGAWRWSGQVQLQALRLSTRLSTLPDIGSYRIVLQGGAQPRLQLSTLRGALQLEGTGQLRDGHWRFQGQAFAQPEHAQAMANLLNLLGQRSGDKTRIQWGL